MTIELGPFKLLRPIGKGGMGVVWQGVHVDTAFPVAIKVITQRVSRDERTLKAFKNDKIRILVATDVAARGLDISNLPYVVNYDVPAIPEDYVHRIGRTGRAGESGLAVSLVSQDEKPHLRAIEKLLGQKIPIERVAGYTEESDVPDYVLYRPNSALSEKKADKAIKEIVDRRNALKQRSTSRSDRKNAKTSKKPTRSGPRFPQASKKSKPRRRR